jgi:hypothetical protein
VGFLIGLITGQTYADALTGTVVVWRPAWVTAKTKRKMAALERANYRRLRRRTGILAYLFASMIPKLRAIATSVSPGLHLPVGSLTHGLGSVTRIRWRSGLSLAMSSGSEVTTSARSCPAKIATVRQQHRWFRKRIETHTRALRRCGASRTISADFRLGRTRRFPQDAAVPRWKLQNIANVRWQIRRTARFR